MTKSQEDNRKPSQLRTPMQYLRKASEMERDGDSSRLIPNYFILLTVIYIASLAWAFMNLPTIAEVWWVFLPLILPLPFLAAYLAYYIRFRNKPSIFEEITEARILKWIFVALAIVAIIWGFLISVPV